MKTGRLNVHLLLLLSGQQFCYYVCVFLPIPVYTLILYLCNCRWLLFTSKSVCMEILFDYLLPEQILVHIHQQILNFHQPTAATFSSFHMTLQCKCLCRITSMIGLMSSRVLNFSCKDTAHIQRIMDISFRVFVCPQL